MSRLEGKVAVVVGAAARDNMGQAIARRFADEGARVLVTGRHADELKRLANAIGGEHLTCDITRKDDLENVATFAIERWDKVDIAVNCTGSGLLEKLLDTSESQLDAMSDLHLKGSFFFLQVFAAAMATHGGSIILTSSASVDRTLFHHAAYIATKAGADAAMRCFANEFGCKGIRINSIAPGLTETPMTAREIGTPGLETAFLNEYPLGRIGTTGDVADAALWLASDESFMTGQVLQVNGGLTLRRNPLPWEINAAMSNAAAKD